MPTCTLFLPTASSPGGRAGPSGSGRTGPSFSRSPSYVVQAPGCRGAGPHRRSTARAGSAQRTSASSTGIFGASETPSTGWGRASSAAVLDPVERGHEQRRPGVREPAEQVAGGVGGPDPLGDHAVRRPGVEGPARCGTSSHR